MGRSGGDGCEADARQWGVGVDRGVGAFVARSYSVRACSLCYLAQKYNKSLNPAACIRPFVGCGQTSLHYLPQKGHLQACSACSAGWAVPVVARRYMQKVRTSLWSVAHSHFPSAAELLEAISSCRELRQRRSASCDPWRDGRPKRGVHWR